MRPKLLAFAVWLIVAATVVRILRHIGMIHLPNNVAPIAALALFGGAYLPRRWAFILPVSAMLLSDLIIGFYNPAIMVSVYASFVGCGVLGIWIRSRRRVATVVGATLIGSTTFFVVTNAAVWAFGTLYPKTIGGLGAAYVAGLPFFRNTVVGDLGFVALLFGLQELAAAIARRSAVQLTPG